MRIALTALTAIILIMYFCIPFSGNPISAPPSLLHLLGTDSYGRDYFLIILLATAISVVEASLAAITAIAFSLTLAFLSIVTYGKYFKAIIRYFTYIIESCPLIVWVFVLLISLSTYPMFSSTLIIFSIAATPFTTTVLFGEIERIWETDYVKAVRLLGIPNRQVFFQNVLPNSTQVTTPVALNLFGAAITVSGAVGFLGFGNKSRIDMGSILFSSKDNFASNPYAFLATSGSFFIIFIIIYFLKRKVLIQHTASGKFI